MPQIYEYPTVNDTLGLNEIVGYVNTVTDGLMTPLLLLAIFVIIFVITIAFGIGRAFTYSCFFCSVLAIFFVVGGWLNPMYMYLLFVLLAIGILILRLGKSSTLPQI